MKKLLLFSFLLPLWLCAQNTPSKHLNLENGLALSGYDPVAYFKQGKAIEGKSTLTSKYNGANYRFSSTDNKALFEKNPQKYVPQYGGWCAYAMGANGDKVDVDPETFKILDGKLYLFYNAFLNNTLNSWNKKEGVLLKKANTNWTKTINN